MCIPALGMFSVKDLHPAVFCEISFFQYKLMYGPVCLKASRQPLVDLFIAQIWLGCCSLCCINITLHRSGFAVSPYASVAAYSTAAGEKGSFKRLKHYRFITLISSCPASAACYGISLPITLKSDLSNDLQDYRVYRTRHIVEPGPSGEGYLR